MTPGNPAAITYPVLDGIPEAERRALLGQLPRRQVPAGRLVVEEGRPTRLMLVESGTFAVWKGAPGTDSAVQIATLQAGECFGERSTLLGGGSASASLTALEAGTLLELDLDAVPDPAKRERITRNLVQTMAGRLLTANHAIKLRYDERTRALAMLGSASRFGMLMTVWMAIYMMLLPAFAWLRPLLPTDSFISMLIIAALFWVAWRFVMRSPGGPAAYGMTLRAWPRQLAMAALFSLPLLALTLGAKAWYAAGHPGTAVFEPWRALYPGPATPGPDWLAVLTIYMILALAQEFVRCAIQGSIAIYQHAIYRRDGWRAPLVGNMIFAATHVHLSPWMPLIVFLPGLYWGWLYHRRGSYLEVAFAHALLGIWGLFILGVPG